MGAMKNIAIELQNSSPLIRYMEYRIQELETHVKGLRIIATELLTAVELKHLDVDVE